MFVLTNYIAHYIYIHILRILNIERVKVDFA